MDNYEVSGEVCRLYSSGKNCPREKRGGCPFVHNMDDRRHALAAKRAARQEAEKARKLAAEHTKLKAQRVKQQKEYDQSKVIKATKTAKAVKAGVITPPSSNAGDAMSNETVTHNTALPLSPPPSPVHAKAGGFAATTNVRTANVSTANVALAPIINGVWQSKHTTSRELCKHFMARRKNCRNPKCCFVHDINARNQHVAELDRLAAEQKALKLASKKVIPGSHVNIDPSDNNSKAVATYASTAAKGIIVAPKFVSPTLSAAPSKTDFWGTQSGLALWAKDNLRDRSQFKLLLPYLGLDKIPADILAIVKNPAKPITGPVFELFRLLPGELRNKIWGYAINNAIFSGRGVRIQLHSDENGDNIVSRTSTPALLRVCQESRSLAAFFYEPAFLNPALRIVTALNFEHDVLFLHTTGPMQLYKLVRLMGGKRVCSRVKHLVVSLKEYLGDRSQSKDYWGRYMSYFCNLESLKLMVGDGAQDLRFHKKSYCEGATFFLKKHLITRYGVNVADKTPTVADKAPKVKFEVVPAVTAHQFGIDELIYMGEGGWGTDKRGW